MISCGKIYFEIKPSSGYAVFSVSDYRRRDLLNESRERTICNLRRKDIILFFLLFFFFRLAILSSWMYFLPNSVLQRENGRWSNDKWRRTWNWIMSPIMQSKLRTFNGTQFFCTPFLFFPSCTLAEGNLFILFFSPFFFLARYIHAVSFT